MEVKYNLEWCEKSILVTEGELKTANVYLKFRTPVSLFIVDFLSFVVIVIRRHAVFERYSMSRLVSQLKQKWQWQSNRNIWRHERQL